MAIELIDRFRGEWKPEKYKDTYRDALMDVIKRKRKGEKIHAEPSRSRKETADLMEALRASLEAHGRRGRESRRPNGSCSAGSAATSSTAVLAGQGSAVGRR